MFGLGGKAMFPRIPRFPRNRKAYRPISIERLIDPYERFIDKRLMEPRSISVLPNLSKVYERLMYDQLYPFLIKSFRNCNAVFVKVLVQNSI